MPNDPLIAQILAKAEGFSNFLEANSYLNELASANPLFEKLDPNEFKYKDYYLLTGIMFIQSSSITGLKLLNNHPSTKADPIMPEWIACLPLGEEKRGVLLVERIRGTENGNVVPYRKARDWVSAEEKDRVVRVLENMLKVANYYCGEMLDINAWFVVPSTGRLVLCRHTQFVTGGGEECHAGIVQQLRGIFS